MVSFILFVINGSIGLLMRRSDRAKEHKSGRMVLCMRAGGKRIKPLAKEGLFTLMVTSMMDPG